MHRMLGVASRRVRRGIGKGGGLQGRCTRAWDALPAPGHGILTTRVVVQRARPMAFARRKNVSQSSQGRLRAHTQYRVSVQEHDTAESPRCTATPAACLNTRGRSRRRRQLPAKGHRAAQTTSDQTQRVLFGGLAIPERSSGVPCRSADGRLGEAGTRGSLNQGSTNRPDAFAQCRSAAHLAPPLQYYRLALRLAARSLACSELDRNPGLARPPAHAQIMSQAR